jgi:radical SAM-linked protein
MVKQRLRLRFEKRGEISLISHHDLMRLFERAARRAGLPIAMTEGFNPRPRMSFPLALGVGVEALREIVEMDLSEWVHPTEVQQRLNGQLPAGLRMIECRAISPRDTAQVDSVVYEIELPTPLPPDFTPEALLQATELPVLRTREDRQKEMDIRPYLLDIRGAGQKWMVSLRVTPSGSVRPEEVVTILERVSVVKISGARITRTHVNIAAGAEGLRRLQRRT